jgi:SAM-dependent methyltransferase
VETGYWRGPGEDAAMQDEHGFIWRAMIDSIDIELGGRRVLDVGCNRGGFLRLLFDDRGIAEGFGYDPASAAIDDARRLAGGRPLTFAAAPTVPKGWTGFDVAFSHEVLYLVDDLPSHAASMVPALRKGGAYFAVMGVHAGSSLMSSWHAANCRALGLPPLYDLDEVAQTFEAAGFDVSVSRLQFRFVPVSAHRPDRDASSLLAWLDYYTHDKVMFRFARPPGSQGGSGQMELT